MITASSIGCKLSNYVPPTNMNDPLRLILDTDGDESEEVVRNVGRTGMFPAFSDESVFLADCIIRNPGLFAEADVCDMGCGTGLLSRAAAVAGARRVYGFDISAEAVSRARRTAQDFGADSIMEYAVADWAAMAGLSAFDVVVANPPFVPAPGGAHLPKTSFGGYLGVTETSHVLRLCATARERPKHLILLSLSLLDGNHRCLVTTLIESYPALAGHLTSVSLYGEPLDLGQLRSVFGRASDAGAWQAILRDSDYDALDYRLFVVSEEISAQELASRSLHHLKAAKPFSGSWEARLNRYRTWALEVQQQ